MVLFGHGYNLSFLYGKDPISLEIIRYTPWHRSVPGLGVIIFFALSGYLVTQSYVNKNSLLHYLAARLLRIYPALIVAVLFCVLVVGASQTTLSLADYFQHPSTLAYLINNATLKTFQIDLPGVFDTLPARNSVNGSLWTLFVELGLYLIVAVMGVVGIYKRPWLATISIAGILVLALVFVDYTPLSFYLQSAPYLTVTFFLGMLFFIHHHTIRLDGRVALSLVVACILLREWNVLGVYYRYVALIPFVYLVMYLAFMSYRLPVLDKYGDFSYGLYLYAYPLQQLSVVWVGEGRPVLVNLLAFSGALFLAIISWHVIEKPALSLVPGRQANRPGGQT